MKKDEYLALISESDTLAKSQLTLLEKVDMVRGMAKDAIAMTDFINKAKRPKTELSTATSFYITTFYFTEGIGYTKTEHKITNETLRQLIVNSVESTIKQFIADNDLNEIIEVLLNPELKKGD